MSMFENYAHVPENAQKQITGGRLNGMTDINPMWRIQCLTEEYGEVGFGWYVEVIEHWTEPQETGEIAMFVRLHLHVKRGGEWSKPIEGCGGSMLVAKESKGMHTDDEAYKKAETDALGTACKKLGIGAAVYWKGYADSKYAKEPVKREEQKATVCSDCGNMIQPIKKGNKKYSVDALVKGSVEKYGVPLCGSCCVKRGKQDGD